MNCLISVGDSKQVSMFIAGGNVDLYGHIEIVSKVYDNMKFIINMS